MSLEIALQANLAGKIQVVGKDVTQTIRSITNITATISDTTDAFLVDAGGGGLVYICPRQNGPGGTPVTSAVTVTVTINANDPVTGDALPSVSDTVTLDPAPPLPPHAVTLGIQVEGTLTLSTWPTDPGTLTVSVTP